MRTDQRLSGIVHFTFVFPIVCFKIVRYMRKLSFWCGKYMQVEHECDHMLSGIVHFTLYFPIVCFKHVSEVRTKVIVFCGKYMHQTRPLIVALWAETPGNFFLKGTTSSGLLVSRLLYN